MRVFCIVSKNTLSLILRASEILAMFGWLCSNPVIRSMMVSGLRLQYDVVPLTFSSLDIGARQVFYGVNAPIPMYK